ncbi:unnamed protein product [Didymodactylos carnosus]|uniref:Lipase-like C-terminal domain-containing protein n=1 Tax=Didymodactylos carnosus TaxID=1234261 RepID=A0A8S2D0X8_9BILA|nr:unnamed protein product [Didymodactylos carnosus]CAF3638837.1 unnamed protein product [Didymodactylos carnosus]
MIVKGQETRQAKLTLPPVVFVSGFLTSVKHEWKQAAVSMSERSTQRSLITALIGPVSSVMDRARELFYCLKGGRVDYGLEHSKKAGHNQFGKIYEHGLYECWSEQNPIHIFGHSLGGPTSLALQSQLEQQLFPGYETSASWIRSITCVSAPMLGTTVSYLLGSCETVPGAVKVLSIGSFLTRAIHLYEWLDLKFLKTKVDFQLGHWNLAKSFQPLAFISSVWNLICGLTGFSPIILSTDNAAFDLTIEGMKLLVDKHIRTFNCSFYQSYTTSYATTDDYSCKTNSINEGLKYQRNTNIKTLPFYFRHLFHSIRQYRCPTPKHDQLQIAGLTYCDADWAENDGCVNTISQAHPHACTLISRQPLNNIYEEKYNIDQSSRVQRHIHCEHRSLHLMSNSHSEGLVTNGSNCSFPEVTPPECSLGVWHVYSTVDISHYGLCWGGRNRSQQRQFFNHTYDKLDYFDQITSRKKQ